MTASMTRDELAEALGQVGRGDRAAFRRVYSATSAKLMGVSLRILGDRQLAEDVLQETYVTVWNRAGVFDPTRASPITWLATIARNRSIDKLRSGARARTSAPIDAASEVVDDAPLASDLIERSEDATRLHACLDQLEERTRQAIRSAFFEGETYETLAARAGAPLGTMKSWIRRGLMRLRGCMAS